MPNITVNMGRAEGVRDVLQALNRLDKAANVEARDAAQDIAQGHARALTAAGLSHPDRRVQLVAGTIRARRDRVPVIAIGGARRLAVSGHARAGDLVWGTEWGAQPSGPNGWRFSGIPRSAAGRWITPTLEARHPEIVRQWADALDRIIRKWS